MESKKVQAACQSAQAVGCIWPTAAGARQRTIPGPDLQTSLLYGACCAVTTLNLQTSLLSSSIWSMQELTRPSSLRTWPSARRSRRLVSAWGRVRRSSPASTWPSPPWRANGSCCRTPTWASAIFLRYVCNSRPQAQTLIDKGLALIPCVRSPADNQSASEPVTTLPGFASQRPR